MVIETSGATRKSIYIPAADRPTWDKAEELAGDSLSGLISSLLERYVQQREFEAKRIVVRVVDREGRGKRVAFEGHWLISPNDEFTSGRTWAVGETNEGRLVVFGGKRGEFEPPRIYDDADEAAGDGVPDDVLSTATNGEYIEEIG